VAAFKRALGAGKKERGSYKKIDVEKGSRPKEETTFKLYQTCAQQVKTAKKCVKRREAVIRGGSNPPKA